MATGRKIVDEADARRCLQQQAACGRPLAVWARARGIDGRSLNIWRVNLARRAGSPRRAAVVRRRPALVEIVPTPRVGGEGAAGGGARYVLDIDGVRVEFGDDFSAATLLRVVQALRAC